MATLNTSQESGAIQRSYKTVADAQLPSNVSSETYGQWALFSVTAPLASAFQQSNKDSILKVQGSGEGELADLIEDFNDGRIQFAYVKVKDPNSKLPKNVLIGWCGEGVPERTKGYFTSHMATVSKILQGYHVSITARSDRDLTPENIIKKVADSSGANYSGDRASTTSSGGPPPPVASKPVFTPTQTAGASKGGFTPLGSRSRTAAPSAADDENDGWGSNAPQVSRNTLEKVESAYKPTKVNMAELTSQKEPSRFKAPEPAASSNPDVVKGGYQPIGKVDIAALRRQAQESGNVQDDRPTTVKGAYEPVGKVDIAAIRARAQGPGESTSAAPVSPARTGGSLGANKTGGSAQDGAENEPKSLTDRSAAFTQSERMTSMPKPKVANRFGSSTSSFTGTKAPAPGGFGAAPVNQAVNLGMAGRNYGNEGGKTPAQLWAERKASGGAPPPSVMSTPSAPVTAQKSGGFQSNYAGKKWNVQIPKPGQGLTSSNDEAAEEEQPAQEEEEDAPSGGVSSIRDRFKNAAPIGMGRPAAARQPSTFEDEEEESAPPPPPMNLASKPNAGARGVPVPGMARPSEPEDEEDEHAAEEPSGIKVPPPPRPGVPVDEDEDEEDETPGSPIRVAMPVGRSKVPEMEPAEELSQPAMPARSLAQVVPKESELEDEPQDEEEDPARGAAEAAAASTFGSQAAQAPSLGGGGKRAIAQFDYEKAEDNELELHEGEEVTNIEMVDEDWWMGENSRGEKGLFPSNYVELQEDSGSAAPPAPVAAPVQHQAPAVPAAPPAPSGGAGGGQTATAQFDYEAAEDNELSFPDGAKITNVEFPDEDWWMGEYDGKKGLFPANYVQLDE